MTAKYICNNCEEDPCTLEIAIDAGNLPELCPWGDEATWENMEAESEKPEAEK
jgi:hypothetical protein